MTYNDYDRLLGAFITELALWKPSEHDFNTTIANARLNSDTQKYNLSNAQRERLFQLYQEARHKELQSNGKD
jgi:hypothetical protein